jgi:hypothetical protein
MKNIQTLLYDYKGKQVEFLLAGDMMVNATEMASVYGKRVVKFLENKDTQEFINQLSKRAIGEFKGPEFGPFLSQFGDLSSEKVVKSPNGVPILISIPGREGATWMHRWLAIDFAMWLDLDFKIWIIEKIDYLLINFSNKQRDLLNQKQELIKNRDLLISKNRDNPDVLKLHEINEELKGISKKLSVTTKNQYSIWSNLNS